MENIFDDIIKPFILKFRKKRYIKNYYLGKIKDGKSVRAALIDSIFVKIVLAFLVYILMLSRTKKWIFSLIISILFVVLYSLISYKIKKINMNRKIDIAYKEMGQKRISSQIKTLSKYEFIDYGKEILERYYDTTFLKYEKEIDLIGEIDDDIYGIKAIKKNLDERVGQRELNEFIYEMKKENIDKGLIITNSYFTKELEEKMSKNIILLDFDDMIEILKSLNLYPTQEEIEDIAYNRFIEKRKNIMRERRNFFAVEKIIKYFILGLVLWLLSRIVSYSLYYKIIGTICILLGFVGILIRIFNIFK